MAEEPEPTHEEVTIVCPFCQELWTVKDVRTLLLSIHVSQHCAETEGFVHG